MSACLFVEQPVQVLTLSAVGVAAGNGLVAVVLRLGVAWRLFGQRFLRMAAPGLGLGALWEVGQMQSCSVAFVHGVL